MNADPDAWPAQGLFQSEWLELQDEFGPELMERVVTVPELAIYFVAQMPPELLSRYRLLTSRMWEVIQRAMSPEVITVGETTCDDVRFWTADILAHEYDVHHVSLPYFAVQRQGSSGLLSGNTVILPVFFFFFQINFPLPSPLPDPMKPLHRWVIQTNQIHSASSRRCPF